MKPFDKNNLLRLQGIMAIASFSVGSLIALVCLFIIDPLGEITSSATGIVSEFLILAGALLGIKTHYDSKISSLEKRLENKENEN